MVAELFVTEREMAELFHSGLSWVEATGQAVAEGFRHDGGAFLPPSPPEPEATVPSIAELQAQVAELSAKLVALI